MTVLSPFDEAIRDFANAQHLLRIKKLLVYACTQHWEADPDQLAQYNLHYLIETLMRLAPTIEQLRVYLNQVTQTLSKSAEYLLIANTIVQTLQKLYAGPISSPLLNANPHVYWQIAQVLEQEAEHLRIRKLLVLVCRNYWETDPDRLLAISVPDLLTELHQLTQSFDHLKAVISSVVETTSKPIQYGAIANSITAACRSLYVSPSEDDTESLTHVEADVTPSNPTYIIGLISPLHDEAETQTNQLEADDDGEPDVIDLETQPIPVFSKAEVYDLRLEIMKYTVPLLSKHLLFLAVYAPPGQSSEAEQAQFAEDPDAWMSLKTRDLDDLILASLKQYPTLQDLSAGLSLTIQALKSPQRYIPVSNAILRAVKMLMVKHRPTMPPAESSSHDRRSTQQTQGDEYTRHASPSTVNFQENKSNTPQPEPIRINLPGMVGRQSFAQSSTRDRASSEETAMFPEFSPPSSSKDVFNHEDQATNVHVETIGQDETLLGRSPKQPHSIDSPSSSEETNSNDPCPTSTDETALFT